MVQAHLYRLGLSHIPPPTCTCETDTQTSRHPDIKTLRHQDTLKSRHSNIKTPRHQDTQTSRHSDIETPGHQDTQTSRHWNIKTPRHQATHTSRHPDIWSLSHSPTPPSPIYKKSPNPILTTLGQTRTFDVNRIPPVTSSSSGSGRCYGARASMLRVCFFLPRTSSEHLRPCLTCSHDNTLTFLTLCPWTVNKLWGAKHDLQDTAWFIRTIYLRLEPWKAKEEEEEVVLSSFTFNHCQPLCVAYYDVPHHAGWNSQYDSPKPMC